MNKILSLLLIFSGVAFAQFTTTARHIAPTATLPAVCSPITGDVHFDNSGAGLGPYYCSAANTWSPMFASAGAGVTTGVTLTADLPVIGAGASAIAIGTKTGTGTTFVTNTSPTLVTPVLGVATVTSVNKVTITAPASGATLTLADGSTLVTSGANSITLTSTGATTVTLPTTGTLVNTAVTTLSSLVSIGTVTTGTWSATTVALNKGGTGQTTKQAAFDALAPTATRAGDITYWDGTHYVNLAGNNSGTNCFQEDSSGVPTWASCGSGAGNVSTSDTLTDGLPILGAGTTAVKIGAWGAGLGIVGITVTLDNTVVDLLGINQTITGIKTLSANKLILTPGADSGTTAGMVNIDASGNLDWYSGGRIYAFRNPMTTAGDLPICSATATPCIPSRLAIGGALTYLAVVGGAPAWRSPICSDISGAGCTIASGAKALATSAIASAACTSAQTATATGTLTTDAISASFNGDPTAVTGYVPLTTGMLTIIVYPTADTVNFKVCNNTNASITPGAITINWRVVR